MPLPPFDVHEAVPWVVSLAYVHSWIGIADACGEGAPLSRHRQQRPQSITSETHSLWRTRRHRIGPGRKPPRFSAAVDFFVALKLLVGNQKKPILSL